MDNFKGENPESPEDILQKIPVLSSYAKGLENHIKERYLKKISVVGVDPAALPSEQLSPECLPPIEVSDLLSYLVLETSHYTNKQQGHPTAIFGKISVRKTISELEFSEHLL